MKCHKRDWVIYLGGSLTLPVSGGFLLRNAIKGVHHHTVWIITPLTVVMEIRVTPLYSNIRYKTTGLASNIFPGAQVEKLE